MRLVLAVLWCGGWLTWGQTTSPGNLSISYVPPANGNQILLQSGDTIPFPVTLAGAQSATSIVIANKSGAAATVQTVAINGTGFAVNTLPILPAQLAAGQQLQFSVVFAPTVMGSFNGSMSIVASGTQYTFFLTGTGSATAYVYQVLGTGSPTPVQANGSISLPSAAVGAAGSTAIGSTVSLSVTNQGNATGTLANVSVSGNAFQLVNPPIFPVTVAPGQTLTLTIGFSPTSIGTITGRLRIENDQFTLTGIGLGSQISVTLLAGSANVPLATNGLGLLPNTTVGSQLALTIQIGNTGNQTGDLTFLSLSGPGFSLVETPTLPVHLTAGASIQVPALLAPATPGTLTAILQVNDQAFTLRTAAGQPPALPAVTIANVPATLAPLQQPSIGIQLAASYPYDLTGQLALTFTPTSSPDDPTVQFSSGGRSATFRIPANTTSAVFADGTTGLGFQTGTTAGTLTVTANILVAGYNLTQSGAPSVTSSIPLASPVIVSLAIANSTATGFQLVITGYSTPRSVTQLSFQFIAAAGANVTNGTISEDVSNAFTQWFLSAGSLQAGTTFVATVQVNISGAMNAIGSVSVSAVNAQGASSPQTVKVN